MTLPDRRPKPRELGPITSQYVKSMGWRSVNLHTHISLVNRYVYVEVPKAGCGTMKATLGGMEGSRMGPAYAQRVQEFPHDRLRATPFIKPFQLPPDLLEAVFASPDYRRFTVVRNPASRLLSAYLEKIQQGLKQSAGVVDAIQARTGLTIAPQDVTLKQFLDTVANQPSREQDPHWRRQADHVGLGIVPFDAVIHLEDLDSHWDVVAGLTSSPDLQEQYFCRNSTGASGKIGDYFTPELFHLITETYARDYAELDYALPS
jgi:hypothetical protein